MKFSITIMYRENQKVNPQKSSYSEGELIFLAFGVVGTDRLSQEPVIKGGVTNQNSSFSGRFSQNLFASACWRTQWPIETRTIRVTPKLPPRCTLVGSKSNGGELGVGMGKVRG
jgi:hypothetical protein